jgi:NAD(P)-dependent dehydrogenase (short-subunit alcohol dehydrogenase family)
VAEVIARHGRIDILVNDAGRSHVGAVEETGEAEQRALFEVHFFGPAALTLRLPEITSAHVVLL